MSVKEQAAKIKEELLARAEADGLSIPGNAQAKGVAVGQVLMQFLNASVFDVEGAYKALTAKYPPKKGKVPVAAAASSSAAAGNGNGKNASGKKKAKAADEEEEEEGGEEEEAEAPKPKKKKTAPKKRKAKEAATEEDGEEEEEKPNKKKKAPAKKKAPKEEEEDEGEEGKKKKKEKLELACEENAGIAEALRELAGAYFKDGDVRRGSSYQKARTAVMHCEVPIRSGKQAKGLNGIGDSIASKIQEFLTSGTISALEEFRARENEVM